MFRTLILKLTLVATAVACSVAAQAADIRTFAFAYQGTYRTQYDADRVALPGSESNFASTGIVGSSLEQQYQFSEDLDDGGITQIELTASSAALGGSGYLKSYVSSSLWATQSGAGVSTLPNYFAVQAQTSYSDSFSVGGDASYISFQFQIDGNSFQGGPASTGLVVFGDLDYPYVADLGPTNAYVSTKLLPVVDGHVDLSLVMDASVTFDLRTLTEDSAIGGFGEVNYFQTLKLVSVAGFNDAAGTRSVAINSLTGADAFDYSQVLSGVVPEPASWAMMVFGFGCVGAAMRRRGMRAFS